MAHHLLPRFLFLSIHPMRILILFLLLSFSAKIWGQHPMQSGYPAFKRGEVLTYRLHYGFLDAGEVTINVSNTTKELSGKPVFHLIGQGRSTGSFDWFFKVRDRYDSYIDEATLLPRLFIRRVDEGGFIINQDYHFQHNQKRVLVSRNGTDKPKNAQNKPFNITSFTHDILSAFYYARNIDFNAVKIGQPIVLNTFFDEEIFPLCIKVLGRETIKTDAGKIRCLKIRPLIQKGRVFQEEEDLTLWVSDDKNHVPVRLEAEVLVGSIKMDLKGYSNLANAFALVK